MVLSQVVTRRPRLTAQAVAQALRLHRGNISAAAQTLGVSRMTVHRYLQRYPTLRLVREEALGELLDMAEAKLVELVQAGDLRAITFVLRTLGRDRGYSERQEHHVEAVAPLVISFEVVDDRPTAT